MKMTPKFQEQLERAERVVWIDKDDSFVDRMRILTLAMNLEITKEKRTI